MSDCVFCKIVKGEIPSAKVFENEHVLAFLDLSQVTKGHTLIIPKSHYSKVQDMDEVHSFDVFNLLWKVSGAIEKAIGVNASTIAIHNGRESGQEVPHVHVHIIPRNTGDGAGPVHSMFRERPQLNSKQFDLIRANIKRMI